jgi:molybdopterin synthase catalytic subunit
LSVRLADSPFAPEQELSEFNADLFGEGALVSFVGLARSTAADGAQVDHLVLEHHPRLTLRSLEEVEEAARKRFEVTAVRIVHRVGSISPGEAIVLAATASKHRRAAFEAADYIMDRLKTDAVFWKREDGSDGSRWVEPREDDHAARERWSEKCPE